MLSQAGWKGLVGNWGRGEYSHFTNSSQTNILRVKFPGELPVFGGISPLENKILIESNPSTFRVLVRKTAVGNRERSNLTGLKEGLEGESAK